MSGDMTGPEAAALYSQRRQFSAAEELARHIPTLVDRGNGTWGTICAACSAKAQDYVQQCTLRGTPTWWPPATLTAPEETS